MNRVAITGFGVVSAVGTGHSAFRNALARGQSGIRTITRFDAVAFAVQLAGEVVPEPDLPVEVGLLAAEDPKVGFAFVAAAEAMAQAGLEQLDESVLLHLGTSLEAFDLSKLVHDGRIDFNAVARRCLARDGFRLQVPLDTTNGLLAGFYGQPGESLVNCSACAAGAQAIGHAFRSVREGIFQTAVCGGFDSMINPLGVGGFQLLGALTTDNDLGPRACRPFDAQRHGAVLGEGAAVFVLEPMDRVVSEGRHVLAEICGYGSSLDAHSLSAPDPDGDGAQRAMMAALHDAGIDPVQIAHINTHGTGTELNDEIEAKAIRAVFHDCWPSIPVAATKSMTGHCIAAAGALELGACLVPLMDGILPPNPSLDRVAPGCELNHIMLRGVPFNGEYALSNSFGFGGQNAALVLRRAEHSKGTAKE